MHVLLTFPVSSHKVARSQNEVDCWAILRLHLAHSIVRLRPGSKTDRNFIVGLSPITCTWFQSALTNFHSNDDLPDPFQMRVYQTSVSMVFSGFSKPYIHFRDVELFDIGHKAQYEIVQAVVQNRGDGPIAQPNFEWCSFHVSEDESQFR